jgi:hypothetical protein
MPSLPDAGGHDDLLRSIFLKIRQAVDPDDLQELVLLALEMLLRRADDQAIKETFGQHIREAIDAVRQETVPSKFFAALRRVGEESIHLLETARGERQPREVVRKAPPDERPTEPSLPRPLARATAPTPWPVLGLSALLVTATAAAMIALATHGVWGDPSGRPNTLTAAQLAGRIVAAAAKPSENLPGMKAGPTLHVARDADDRVILVVDAVPRRICPATGWLLAGKGRLTIGGQAPARPSKSAITALCRRHKGDPDMTWSPNPS